MIKIAWVTGASSCGLGYYHAMTLAEAGANVVVSDLSSRAVHLSVTETDLRKRNVNVLALHTHASDYVTEQTIFVDGGWTAT